MTPQDSTLAPLTPPRLCAVGSVGLGVGLCVGFGVGLGLGFGVERGVDPLPAEDGAAAGAVVGVCVFCVAAPCVVDRVLGRLDGVAEERGVALAADGDGWSDAD
jgi:hypothetical protein